MIPLNNGGLTRISLNRAIMLKLISQDKNIDGWERYLLGLNTKMKPTQVTGRRHQCKALKVQFYLFPQFSQSSDHGNHQDEGVGGGNMNSAK